VAIHRTGIMCRAHLCMGPIVKETRERDVAPVSGVIGARHRADIREEFVSCHCEKCGIQYNLGVIQERNERGEL
jgi:hypothetical protein